MSKKNRYKFLDAIVATLYPLGVIATLLVSGVILVTFTVS